MPEAVIAGHPTAWRVWGKGRPVLALHCALAHAGAWAGIAEGLPGLAFTAPDSPGHGRSGDWDGIGDYHALTTRVVVGLAETLAHGAPLDLIGHSLGGTVALRVAIERPDLVRSLTLIEPVLFAAASGSAVWPAFQASNQQVVDLIAQGDLENAARMFHAEWGGEGCFDDLPARQRTYMTARMPLIAAPDSVLLTDSARLLPRFAQIKVPVHLIEGENSPPVVAAIIDHFAEGLPQARRDRVPGAGHMLPISHATAVAALLRDVLRP